MEIQKWFDVSDLFPGRGIKRRTYFINVTGHRPENGFIFRVYSRLQSSGEQFIFKFNEENYIVRQIKGYRYGVFTFSSSDGSYRVKIHRSNITKAIVLNIMLTIPKKESVMPFENRNKGWVIARIVDETLSFGTHPKIHSTRHSAETELRRLCSGNPGLTFVIFESVGLGVHGGFNFTPLT